MTIFTAIMGMLQSYIFNDNSWFKMWFIQKLGCYTKLNQTDTLGYAVARDMENLKNTYVLELSPMLELIPHNFTPENYLTFTNNFLKYEKFHYHKLKYEQLIQKGLYGTETIKKQYIDNIAQIDVRMVGLYKCLNSHLTPYLKQTENMDSVITDVVQQEIASFKMKKDCITIDQITESSGMSSVIEMQDLPLNNIMTFDMPDTDPITITSKSKYHKPENSPMYN